MPQDVQVPAADAGIGGVEPGSGETLGSSKGESGDWTTKDEYSRLGCWAPVWGGRCLT